jgi:predicted PurR-regulated permease PerM
MKVRIEIDTKTFVRFWLVVIGFAFALFAMYSARTALIIIFVSLFLAVALSPSVNKLAGLLPGRSRMGGTALAYVAVVAVLTGFLFVVVPPIIEQTAKFAQAVPAFVDSATNRWGGLNEIITRYGLEDQVDSAAQSVQENASTWASNLGSTIVSGAGSLFSFLAASLIVLFTTFFMLVEGPTWVKRIWKVYQNKDRMLHHKALASKIYAVVTSYVNGQLLVALIASSLAALVVFLLSLFFNVPANLAAPTFAVVFLGALIPMFGATIAGVLVAVLLAFNDLTAAIVFAVYFIIYQQVENNVITTVIQSKTLDLSPLDVIRSVTDRT